VCTEWKHKSVSQERTFASDVGAIEELLHCLLKMSDEVSSQLRKEGECARVVVLKMRYPDFTTITRRVTLVQPTDLAEVLYNEAGRLLRRELKPGVKLRLIGVGASGLTQSRQLALFGVPTQQLSRLSQAVDDIRRRYGRDSIRRASFLDRTDEGPESLSRKGGS
jgi:DNA polymerase-4